MEISNTYLLVQIKEVSKFSKTSNKTLEFTN